MAKFQIQLYRAVLKNGITPDEAQELAQLAEDFIVRKVEDANRNLIADLQAMKVILGFIMLLTTISAGIGTYLAALHD